MYLKAKTMHLPAIVSLLQENSLPIEDISLEKQELWIQQEEQEIPAVCGIEQYGAYGLLRSFAVQKELQNKGLGTHMYEHVIKTCQDKGIACLFLLTTTAVNYFKSAGWHVISRVAVPAGVKQSEEFKSICPESATCMMLVLDDSFAKSAMETFNTGFNCAQSVLTAFTDKFGMDNKQALKLATGFGAGIGFKGQTCGAVTGAYMAIGLNNGRSEVEDDMSRELTFMRMKKFDEAFIKQHGGLNCSELLNGNVAKQEELDKIMENELFTKACPVYVYSAAKILEKVLQKDLN